MTWKGWKYSGVCLSVFAFVAVAAVGCGEMEEPEQQQQQDDNNNDGNNNDGNNNDGNNNDGNNNDYPDIDPEDYDIEVAGVWDTNFDTVEVITDEEWGFREVVEFDNATREAIVYTPEDDDFNPDTYGRVLWTELEDDTFHYCQDVIGEDTPEDAEQAETGADREDLESSCGGFEWTEMTRR